MRATRKRDKYCTEEQMKKTFLQSIRTMATLLFLLVGNLLQQMWAADIKYYIINNKGKVCFQYVIKDGFSYTSVDRTKLCVHPWARSMVAKDFRFYTDKADAVADAAGTEGSYFHEGDVISEVAEGTTAFYVRYSMKSQIELEDEGFIYDPNGNMTYLIQIRERNTNNRNAHRRQAYFDNETADHRFEFNKFVKGNRTDIPDNELQTTVPYRFRFDTKGDAYGVYIYNGGGESLVPGGVLTVKGVGRGDAKATKQKNSITYENIISDYDPESSDVLQTFSCRGPFQHYSSHTVCNGRYFSLFAFEVL